MSKRDSPASTARVDDPPSKAGHAGIKLLFCGCEGARREEIASFGSPVLPAAIQPGQRTSRSFHGEQFRAISRWSMRIIRQSHVGAQPHTRSIFITVKAQEACLGPCVVFRGRQRPALGLASWSFATPMAWTYARATDRQSGHLNKFRTHEPRCKSAACARSSRGTLGPRQLSFARSRRC